MERKVKKVNFKQNGMVVALIAIYLLFFILTGGKNATVMNINNLIMQNSYVVILSVGMLLCVLTGNIDLGVGSVVALTGAIGAILVVDFKVPVLAAFLVVLVVGLLIGIFQSYFISILEIPPFIVTLAVMLMARGLTYTALKAQTKGPLPKGFTQIGAGYLPTINIGNTAKPLDLVALIIAAAAIVLTILSVSRSRRTQAKYGFDVEPVWQSAARVIIIAGIVFFILFSLARYRGIPVVLVLLAALVALYQFITAQTVAGRHIYATGGNVKAARLSGINTKKVFFWVYTNMALLSAVAGIVLSARNASATPKAGDGFELDAIGACYIGGAATYGGSGTIMGAVVGAFIMGVLNNGMSLLGLSTDIQKVVKGAVLLGAVTIDLVSKKKRK